MIQFYNVLSVQIDVVGYLDGSNGANGACRLKRFALRDL